MKKIIATFTLLIIVLGNAKSQKVYVGVEGGFGFPASKDSYSNQTTSYSASGNVTTYNYKHYSFGKGYTPGLYIGYMAGKYVGIELGASYLIGSKYSITSISSDQLSSNEAKLDETIKGRMFRLTPTLKFTLGEKNIHPYIKAGLIIGLAGKVIEEATITDKGYIDSVTQETRVMSGNISLGFHGAIGLNFTISDRIHWFAEVSYNFQNWAPKKDVLTKFTANGKDKLSSVSNYDKETDFVDSYTTNSSFQYGQSNTAAQQAGKTYLPFSSVGLTIGIHFVLGKKEL